MGIEIHDMKNKTEGEQASKRKGCLHTLLFGVVCGIAAIFLLFASYNMIVRTNGSTATEMEQEEEDMRKALLDTFDVVGDYLFPRQKADREDLMTDAEKEAELKGVGKDIGETDISVSANAVSDEGNDIMESADISSDPNPVPSTSRESSLTPTVEKLESPTITPIE